MELSTSMPTAKEIPARLTTLKLRLLSQRKIKQPMTEIGIARAVVNVDRDTAQKGQQYRDCQKATDQNVLFNQIDGGIDVGPFIVEHFQQEAMVIENGFIQVLTSRSTLSVIFSTLEPCSF